MTVNLEGRRVIVSEPDGSERGRLSVDMLTTLAKAREEGAAACFLRPAFVANDALFALTTGDVPLVQPQGLARTWVRRRWDMTQWVERARARAADASASFWLEWYRELRRHVSDERLPIDLRGRLREHAHRSFERSTRVGSAAPRFPRMLIRNRVRMQLPQDLLDAAQTAASGFGVNAAQPYVAIDTRARRDTLAAALELLASSGYAVVPLGRSPLVDVFVLLTCEFLICDSSDVQRLAYLTNTPTLAINATDAYTFYPVRSDGLYLLKTAIDLDSGRALTSTEMLDEAYYRNQRNSGFRDNSADDIAAAVAEMMEGRRNGWTDSDSQARYRAHVVNAGTATAVRVRHVAKWGPVDGFIGDGRLARIQADRTV